MGKCFDKEGNTKYEISGSWLDEIFLTDLSQGENSEPELIW